MARILVTEKIADPGLERLRAAGHEVDVREGLTPEQLLDAVRGAHALIIRSATDVTADVLAAGVGMIVVGRAGIGLDNVDVEAATRHGVMVVNAPQSNVISAAEHTMALILSQARNVPQANAALKAGRWERSKWEGVELTEKTLGIIGLGRIGKLVAQRSLAFGMRLIAYDPFVAAERARQLSVELVDLDTLMAQSDFITVHVAKTPQTVGLINAERLALMRSDAILLNFSRDGIVDNGAVLAGLAAKKLKCYVCDFPAQALVGKSGVIALPHLGASTREAEDNCAIMVVDQLRDYLEHGNIQNAVNFPDVVMAREAQFRVGIANSNVPNMLGQISTAMADAGLNIHNMLNKSKGEMAYTLVDVDSAVPAQVVEKIAATKGVLAVRYLPSVAG